MMTTPFLQKLKDLWVYHMAEPCDTGTIWDRIAKPIIGQLECKCCILWRGIIIGALIPTIIIGFML